MNLQQKILKAFCERVVFVENGNPGSGVACVCVCISGLGRGRVAGEEEYTHIFIICLIKFDLHS